MLHVLFQIIYPIPGFSYTCPSFCPEKLNSHVKMGSRLSSIMPSTYWGLAKLKEGMDLVSCEE